MSINKKTFGEIVRQAVIDYPATLQGDVVMTCLRANTYAWVEEEQNISTENLGMSERDYDQGYFWSRTWANDGADVGNIIAEYPYVLLESRKFNMDDHNTEMTEVWLTVMDTEDCNNCPEPCNRSRFQVQSDIEVILKNILVEVRSAILYHVIINGEEQWVWLSQGRYDWMVSEGIIEDTIEWTDDMSEVITQDDFEVTLWGDTRADKQVAVSVKLVLMGCDPDEYVAFNYSNNQEVKLPTAKCDTC